nr:ABC-type transport auxiliary lipoprotein family protein [Ancylobacter crimeensis]
MVLGLAATGLGGCAALLGGNQAVPTFDLSAPRAVPVERTGVRVLVISDPTSLAVLNTEKIVVEPQPGQVAYLGNAQWSDRLPPLFQARLIETFENSSRARSVARPGDRVTADYVLLTDIRSFGLQTFASPEAVVEVSAKIVDDRAGRIVAAKVFTGRAPAGSSSGAEATRALDAASDQVFIELVKWASGY